MSLICKNHHYYSLFFMFIAHAVIILGMPSVSGAQMSEVDENELSKINAQSGISYVIGDSQYHITTDSYRFSDTDHDPHNWIQLNNITIDDGYGNPFSMNTPANEADFNTIDVGTDVAGLTHVLLNLSMNVDPRTYTIGNFVFCNQDLGSLRLEDYRNAPSNRLTFTARNDGSSGINFDYQTEIMIGAAKFIYNNTPESLSLSNIHLSEYAYGDPADPTSWYYSGKFKLGDPANNNPATIDVGTVDNGDGTTTTSVFYNIPMKGSIRVQDVNFGGKSLGPCAIDGINVHRLGIQIPGN